MNYIFAIFFLFYLGLAIKRIDWALMLLLFLLPAYQIRFNIFGLPSTLLEGMILISFAVWLPKNWKQQFKNIKTRIMKLFGVACCELCDTRRYPFDIEIVLFLIVSWISIAVAGFSTEALGIWKAYFFEPILVYILMFNTFGGKMNANLQMECKSTNESSAPFSFYYKNIEKVYLSLGASALAVALWAVFQRLGVLPSPANFLPRVTGPFPYPNALGLYVGPLIPLMLGFLFFELRKTQDTKNNEKLRGNLVALRNDQKILDNQIESACKNDFLNFRVLKFILIIISIITSLASLFLASSEGAVAGVLLALFFISIFGLAWRLKNELIVKIGKIILALVFVFVLISPLIFLKAVPENKYFDFGSKTLNYISDKILLKDFSGEVRKQQWRETWQFLAASPKNFIFGAGLSGYQAAVAPYHKDGIFFNAERDPRFYNELVWGTAEYKTAHWRPVEIYMYPHSLVLNFWMELGLIGVIVFAWLVMKSIWYLLVSRCFEGVSSINRHDTLLLGLMGAFVVMIIHGIVDVPYFKNDLAVMFWVLVAMIGAMGQKFSTEL